MTDIEVLEREKQCVQRKGATNCSDCAHCDLLMDEAVILATYDRAISALRESVQAEQDGWLVVLPCKVGDGRYMGNPKHRGDPYIPSESASISDPDQTGGADRFCIRRGGGHPERRQHYEAAPIRICRMGAQPPGSSGV